MSANPLNARRTTTAPATQVVSSVVLCGCPVMMPFGWVMVWRAVVQQVAVPTRDQAEPRTIEALDRLVSLN